jgi:hypothetical protein
VPERDLGAANAARCDDIENQCHGGAIVAGGSRNPPVLPVVVRRYRDLCDKISRRPS